VYSEFRGYEAGNHHGIRFVIKELAFHLNLIVFIKVNLYFFYFFLKSLCILVVKLKDSLGYKVNYIVY